MLLLSALLLTSSYAPGVAPDLSAISVRINSDKILTTPHTVTVLSSEDLSNIPNPHDPGSVIDAIQKLEMSTQGVAVRGGPVTGQSIVLRGRMPSVQFNIDGTPTSATKIVDLLEAIERVEVLGGSAAVNPGASAIYGTHSQTINWLKSQFDSAIFEAPEEPDMWSQAEWTFSRTSLAIEYSFNKVLEYPSIDYKEEESLGSFSIDLGTYNLPLGYDNPTVTELVPSDTWQISDPLHWRVGGILFKDQFAQQLDVGYLSLPYKEFNPKLEVSTSPAQYIADAGAQTGPQMLQDIINRSGYDLPQISDLMQGAAPQGTSMNSMNFPGTPSLLSDVNCGSELFFPSGTLWVPDRPGHQVMSNFQPFSYQFNFENSRSGPISFTQEQIEFRTHCLNMEKRQPAAGVRYYPYYSPDPVIRALMIMTNNTRIRGPWLQAQTWIYTDKASLEQINELLVPPVSPARYVEGLYAVAMAGGFSQQDYLNAAMFNPALLGAIILRPEIAYWMMLTMAEYHAEATRRWFENSGGNIGAILQGEDEQAKTAIMNLIALAIYSPTPTIRMGVLMLLMRLENPTNLLPGLPTPYYSLASEDSNEVALAERVVEKYSLR